MQASVFTATILGSSAATPTSTRNPSAILLNMDYHYYLVDCGEGTQIQLRRMHYKLQKINHVFVSHLHGDHFFGVIGLISTMHLMGRDRELHVFGPPRLEEIVNLQLDASQTELVYPLVFHPTQARKEEVIYESDKHYVKSFPLEHRIPTTGFVFGEKPRRRKIDKAFLLKEDVPVPWIVRIKDGADYTSPSGIVYPNDQITRQPPAPRTFAYCSDTRYNPAIAQYLQGVDLLYHEATFMEELREVATEKYHSTAAQAALTATQADAKHLLLGHFSARYKTLDGILEEAKAVFANTSLAQEGEVIEV
ncbi:MAG: ribonuclease Z [Clostridia bacterium]|nr:ribonuclease Z [Clostridia bacterium]